MSNEALSREAVGSLVGREGLERSDRFSALVRNHHPELVQHVYRRVGSWADADDIVQQTFFNLLRVRGLSAVSNVRAYLFKMAGNLALDWNRKRRVRQSFAEEELLREPVLERSAEDVCLSRDELEHLLTFLDDLPQQARRALLLYRHEGLSLEEVGVQLGIKPRSVWPLISRATKFLLETVPQEELTRRGRK